MVMVVLGHNVTKLKLSIEQLANVSRFYRSIQICEHDCEIKTSYDFEGRIVVSFKVTVKPGESDGNFILLL